MFSIDDFLAHRWEDAKVELRKLDADFVHKVESEVRLQALGLEPPWTPDVNRVPVLRLSSTWHRLLEACTELARQVSILKTMEGNNVKSGKHDRFVAETEALIGCLGTILESLEADIQGRILD